jgi:hypothetical protein
VAFLLGIVPPSGLSGIPTSGDRFPAAETY